MNEIKRILELMVLKPSLLENVNEQESFPEKYRVNSDSENDAPQSTIEKYGKYIRDPKTIYPNYCKYPDKTVLPGKNPKGASGADALPMGTCMYLAPKIDSKDGGSNGFFVRNDAKIYFWDEKSITDWANTLSSKYKGNSEIIKSRLVKILPTNSIRAIIQDGKQYKSRVTRPFKKSGYNYSDWMFVGFFTKENEMYKQPNWTDERNEYQKFIDEWNFTLQIGAAIGTALLGWFTGGAAWVLALEAVLEGTVGLAVGLRDIEKGDNIGGMLNILFGFIPVAKYVPELRGVSQETLKKLGQSFKESGLTSKSTAEEFSKFYIEKLSKEEQLVLSKILKYDEYSKNTLLKNTKEAITSEMPKLVIKQFETLIKKQPDLVKKVAFWQRLWAREVGVVGLLVVLNAVLETTIGDGLTKEERDKLSGVFEILPDNLKIELALNLANNPEKTKSFVNKWSQTNKSDLSSETYQKDIADTLISVGGKYVNYMSSEYRSQQITDDDIKLMKDKGYVLKSELPQDEETPDDYIPFKGKLWYKLN